MKGLTMDFKTDVLPYIQKDSEPFDKEDKKQLLKKWQKFEKLEGIEYLIRGMHKNVTLEIFNFTITLD
jgi:hypothetical protein